MGPHLHESNGLISTSKVRFHVHAEGLCSQVMGLLLVLVPMMAFVGGFFWSSIVDRSGEPWFRALSVQVGSAVVSKSPIPALPTHALPKRRPK